MLTDYIVYLSSIGIVVALLLLLFYLFRRVNWILGKLRNKKVSMPGLASSIRNLILIILLIAVLGMLLFAGFFTRSYYAFTYEKPIAEIFVEGTGQEKKARITLIQFVSPDLQITRKYLINGDQWMLEGDILKWDNWLNFIGVKTRYRLTRIRGRFLRTEDELTRQQTVYSLVDNENHPLWRYLYEFGPELPFVSTVYGNAVFQMSDKEKRFMVAVGTSGFLVREISN